MIHAGKRLIKLGAQNVLLKGGHLRSKVMIDILINKKSVIEKNSGKILSSVSKKLDYLIVGLKPTTGLVSRSGIIPISSSQDTAGPMGATVDIVAKTLEVIAGYDENDPATYSIPSNFDFNFSREPVGPAIPIL